MKFRSTSERPGVNPMNGLQAFIYKLVNASAFVKSLVVTAVVQFNPLSLVITFKVKFFNGPA